MAGPAMYFATPPVNLIYAYDVALEIVLEEGMTKREQRHIAFGKGMRQALASYGLIPLAEEEVAAATLSCILYPEGIDDAKFRASLSARGIIVAGSLAHLAGKAFRIGHMGNVTADLLTQAIEAIGEALQEQGKEVDIQKAVALFQNSYSFSNC